jgi:hypothetical protein
MLVAMAEVTVEDMKVVMVEKLMVPRPMVMMNMLMEGTMSTLHMEVIMSTDMMSISTREVMQKKKGTAALQS